jgi:hypothetical protein
MVWINKAVVAEVFMAKQEATSTPSIRGGGGHSVQDNIHVSGVHGEIILPM